MSKNISEEERHEAATVGCPSRGIPKLPGGFDGTEPAKTVSEEGRAKVEQCVVRQRQKLTQIADLALAAEAKSGNADVKLGSKYLENSEAIAEIRRICKESAAEEICPDYEWLAKIVTGEHFEPECLAKAIEAEASQRQIEYPTFYTPGWLCDLAKWLQGKKDEVKAEIQREEARQKRKIHWTCYPTKVDVCVMGKTEQNGKVYEVRISKRGDSKVQDTYGQCKVNGKTVITCSFTGSAWMLESILTRGMQALVNYKAKRNRDSRRNYKRRDDAAKQQAHDSKQEGK